MLNDYYIYHIQCNGDWFKLKNDLISHPDVKMFFDSRNLICEEQLKIAILKAERAMENKLNIANKFQLEVMIQLSGEHQIQKAISLFDFNESSDYIVILQDNEGQIIENSAKGFPPLKLSQDAFNELNIGPESPCKEIIAKSARLTLDYE